MFEALTFLIAIAACGAILGLMAFAVWTIITGVIEFINFLFDVFCDDNKPEGTL